MRTYELMVIHRPDNAEDDVRNHVGTIVQYLSDRGVDEVATDEWGKRRFAYEIEHLHEGYYTVLSFGAEPSVVDELERQLSLSDRVLRHKVVKLETAEAKG